MKRLVVALLSVLMFTLSANAGSMRAKGMTMVRQGGFGLGMGIGVPGWRGVHAVMPMVTVDGAWGLASGFIKTSKFGNNGAVDLGFQYGVCGYDVNMDWYKVGGLQNMVMIRTAFHFQFLTTLETYTGFCGGVDISSPVGDNRDRANKGWGHTSAMFGLFFGVKWYFTDVFGLKLEFEGDFADGNQAPPVVFGCTWRF